MKKIAVFQLKLLAMILSTAAAAHVAAQTKKTNQAQKSDLSQNAWQEIKWEEQGFSYSLPPQFKPTEIAASSKQTQSDGFKNEERVYEQRGIGKSMVPKFRVAIDVILWKGEKFKTENEGKEVELTPEQMIELNYIGDQRALEEKGSPVEEVSYWDIDNLKGIYVLSSGAYNEPKDKTPNAKIRVVWGTFRLYKGNVQKIAFAIEARRKDLPTMKKIIASAKFAL